jgi:hypothetical protein
MILTLNRDFVVWERYKVTVLKVQDIYWQNIISWVDSEAEFDAIYFSPESNEVDTTNDYDNDTNSNIEANNEDNENNDDENIEPDLWWVWWVSLNSWDVENQVLVVAEDNSKLPTTWPEHILILVIALIIGWWLFIYKYRKI